MLVFLEAWTLEISKMNKRPDAMIGVTYRVRTGCGNLYVTVNYVDKLPVELFINMGKAGGCASSQTEALGRLASLALRGGVSLKELVKELTDVRCHLPAGDILSCADAVGKVLASRIKEEDEDAGQEVQEGD